MYGISRKKNIRPTIERSYTTPQSKPPKPPDQPTNMEEDPTIPLEVPRTSFKDALLKKSEDINLAYVRPTQLSELVTDPDEEMIMLS